jgi:hypothetical protein
VFTAVCILAKHQKLLMATRVLENTFGWFHAYRRNMQLGTCRVTGEQEQRT